jgi:hypothetical protein
MEKRIRIVWALSLISMLLLVAGQGYWLWNQYQYKNEEYEEEIHRLVMDAVAVNDSIRREQPKKVFNKPNISFFNTNVDMHTDRDSLTNKLKERYTRTFVVGAMADKSVLSTAMKDSIVYKDKIVIHGEDKLLFNMSFSEAIVAYQLQIDVPFTLQRFDSVLLQNGLYLEQQTDRQQKNQYQAAQKLPAHTEQKSMRHHLHIHLYQLPLQRIVRINQTDDRMQITPQPFYGFHPLIEAVARRD